ncbi:MAG: hypothetical protein LBK63_13550 [Treponema sp.]|nr:hypothetical protein [Treponema sp.]
MKNIARLALFFSVFLIVAFVLAGILEYVRLVLDAARTIPAGSPVRLGEFMGAFRKILPLLLYCAILMSLSYSARLNIVPATAILSVFILAGGALLGLSLGFRDLKNLDIPLQSGSRTRPLGGSGLILSRGDTVVILLGEPGISEGGRIISFPGRPLIYQENPSGLSNAALPPIPFREGDSALMQSLFVDSALAAKQLETRLDGGLLSFGLYAGAMLLLLASLRFVLDLSSWPLANLFCGALAFRGVLAFQTFVDSQIVQTFIISFFDRRIEGAVISPIIFTGLALAILLYTFLVNLARRESSARASRQSLRRLRQKKTERRGDA